MLNARNLGTEFHDAGLHCDAIELQDITHAYSGNSVPDYSMVEKQFDSGQVPDAGSGSSAQTSGRNALASDSSTVVIMSMCSALICS